jgi:hypothetical protein
LSGSFIDRRKLFGLQISRLEWSYDGSSFQAGMGLVGGTDKAGMTLFGWQLRGWDEIIRVPV